MACKTIYCILKDVLTEINYLYEILIAETVCLPREDKLLGTDTKIINTKTVQGEFDVRVKE